MVRQRLLRHLMDDVDPVELPAFGIPVAAPAKCAMATVQQGGHRVKRLAHVLMQVI